MLIYYTINEYIKEWKEDDIIACPPKSIPTRIGYMSKNEIDTRIEYEARLRGSLIESGLLLFYLKRQRGYLKEWYTILYRQGV